MENIICVILWRVGASLPCPAYPHPSPVADSTCYRQLKIMQLHSWLDRVVIIMLLMQTCHIACNNEMRRHFRGKFFLQTATLSIDAVNTVVQALSYPRTIDDQPISSLDSSILKILNDSIFMFIMTAIFPSYYPGFVPNVSVV